MRYHCNVTFYSQLPSHQKYMVLCISDLIHFHVKLPILATVHKCDTKKSWEHFVPSFPEVQFLYRHSILKSASLYYKFWSQYYFHVRPEQLLCFLTLVFIHLLWTLCLKCKCNKLHSYCTTYFTQQYLCHTCPLIVQIVYSHLIPPCTRLNSWALTFAHGMTSDH